MIDHSNYCFHVSYDTTNNPKSPDNPRVCGANSDLFGRRWFIVGGNLILFVGFIVGGTAKNNTSLLAAMSLIGFVSSSSIILPHFTYQNSGCRQCSTRSLRTSGAATKQMACCCNCAGRPGRVLRRAGRPSCRIICCSACGYMAVALLRSCDRCLL